MKKLAKYTQRITLVVVFVLCFAIISTPTVHAAAGSPELYCNKYYNSKKHSSNDKKIYNACVAAWKYGHKTGDKGPTYDAGGYCYKKYPYSITNTTYKIRYESCKDGYSAKISTKTSGGGGDTGTSSSGGGSGGGTTTTGSSDLGDNNDQIKDEKTEDGIDANGAKINADAVKLNSNDADSAGFNNNQPGDIVAGILNVVYALSASIAIIVIIVAGIMYITSDGDPARITRAKNAIIYSAVGLVIIGSAFLLTGLIQGIAAG